MHQDSSHPTCLLCHESLHSRFGLESCISFKHTAQKAWRQQQQLLKPSLCQAQLRRQRHLLSEVSLSLLLPAGQGLCLGLLPLSPLFAPGQPCARLLLAGLPGDPSLPLLKGRQLAAVVTLARPSLHSMAVHDNMQQHSPAHQECCRMHSCWSGCRCRARPQFKGKLANSRPKQGLSLLGTVALISRALGSNYVQANNSFGGHLKGHAVGSGLTLRGVQ